MIAAVAELIEDCFNTKLVKNFSRLGSAAMRKATSSLMADQTFELICIRITQALLRFCYVWHFEIISEIADTGGERGIRTLDTETV